MKEIKLSDIFVLNGPVPFYVDEEKKLITYYCPWCGDNVGGLSFHEKRPAVISVATIGEDFILRHLELGTSDDCNNYVNKVVFDFDSQFKRSVFEGEFKMLFKRKDVSH